MKRFISIVSAILLLSAAVFADDYYEDDEEYDDGYVYEQNGAGDQFLKIDLAANFPLNFGEKLYPGMGASVGYYYFLTNNLALGGDAILGYNLSIGKKPLVTIPITFGAMYQPYIGKLEFPLMLNVGFATVTCQTMMYFPALSVKFSAGAYYRYSESWSFGLSTNTFWIPQWFKNSDYNDNGIFTTTGLTVRYHF